MANQSYQELETRIVGIETQVAAMGQALTWLMVKLNHSVKSPIIGGETTSQTFLELYQEDMKRIMEAGKPEPEQKLGGIKAWEEHQKEQNDGA